MIEFMQNKDQSVQTGISFIEILVVLLLMSLFMSLAIPRFFSSQKGRAKKQFFTEFSTLVADSMYQAMTSHKIHQIFWDLQRHQIEVKIYDTTAESKDKHQQFKPVTPDVFHSTMKIPESFIVHNFYIQQGEDEIKPGETKNAIWTYIMPDGTSQQVTINIQDENETDNNQFSITINPFYSQVSLHDSFQKP